ncbi:Syntaxin-51 [Cardamine amara subsp. amara]|uniref:Syntaxin-51 n=1 Tax=Cardamine amara subsp. amara TaxID=228776 RepID=A0ABD1BUX9_CARAN
MISERSSLAERGYDPKRHATALRRKITILATRVEILQSLLPKIPGKPISEKEMNRRKGMIENLRSNAHQVASAMNMSNFGNIESLLGPDDIMSRVTGMDNQGIVGFQRQVMREQDEALEKLEETVIRTKLIAMDVNKELGLQTKLIDDLGNHVDVSVSGLAQVERSLKYNGIFMSILLSVLEIFGRADLICDRNDEVQKPKKDQKGTSQGGTS